MMNRSLIVIVAATIVANVNLFAAASSANQISPKASEAVDTAKKHRHYNIPGRQVRGGRIHVHSAPRSGHSNDARMDHASKAASANASQSKAAHPAND
jgi:putative aminopeptidase FrvX